MPTQEERPQAHASLGHRRLQMPPLLVRGEARGARGRAARARAGLCRVQSRARLASYRRGNPFVNHFEAWRLLVVQSRGSALGVYMC